MMVSTHALLEASKNAVVVNNEGTFRASDRNSLILNKIINFFIWKKFAVLELYGIEMFL